MNYSALAALVALATLFLTAGGIIWIGGKLAQRVDDHGVTLKEHGTKLETHGQDITALKSWRDGYNAAIHKRSE